MSAPLHSKTQVKLTVHRRDRLDRVRIRKAEEDVEEHDQNASYTVDHESEIAHPKRSFRDVCSLREQVWQDGQEIACRCQDDKRPDETVESCLGAKLNRTYGRAKHCAEDSRRDWARKPFVDLREKSGEWGSVVTREHPEKPADHGDRGYVAHKHVQQDDEEQAESRAVTASCLPVHFRKGEGSAAIDHCIQIVNPVEDGNSVTKRSQETETDLREDRFREVDLRVGQF